MSYAVIADCPACEAETVHTLDRRATADVFTCEECETATVIELTVGDDLDGMDRLVEERIDEGEAA